MNEEITYPLESFIFYLSFRDALNEMDDTDKLTTLLAICDFALYGIEPVLENPLPRAVFTVARPSIEANQRKRLHGSKGGRPTKKAKNSGETSGLQNKNHRFSNCDSTDTDTGTGTDTEADTKRRRRSKASFCPPTVEQVREYCLRENLSVDADVFCDYFESSGWRLSNGNKMKSWESALRNWSRREQKQSGTGQNMNTYQARNSDPGDWLEG